MIHPPLFLKPGVPAVLLAPMEGVTDAPMRAFLGEPGRSAFTGSITEFLRVSQDIPPRRVLLEHMPELANGCRTPGGLPVELQLLGGDPEKLAETASRAVGCGALGIDLNFGCPAPTVNRHDGGASLLKDPERLERIVRTVRQSVPAEIPVSAKLRLGWDDPKTIHETSLRAARAGASWITIHGRTRMQGYAPPAHWEPIGEVQRQLGKDLAIVANGDLWDLEAFKRCRDITGCSHFMLGRSALSQPLLSHAVARELGLPATETPAQLAPTLEAWLPWIERFIEVSLPFSDHPLFITRRVKQWLKHAQNQGSIAWFDEIKTLQTPEEVLARLREPKTQPKG